jgi:hypothetical protein
MKSGTLVNWSRRREHDQAPARRRHLGVRELAIGRRHAAKLDEAERLGEPSESARAVAVREHRDHGGLGHSAIVAAQK